MPNTQTPQPNPPNEPEDMLAGVNGDSGTSPLNSENPLSQPGGQPLQSTASMGNAQPGPLQPPMKPQMSEAAPARPNRAGRGTRVRLIILAVVVGIFVLSLIVLFFVRSRTSAPSPAAATNTSVPATVPSEENGTTSAPTENGVDEEPIRDSDGDGLLDSEEFSLGTDIEKIDTDDDGLNDRQEVRVYQTDPNNEDTDGDSFTDGEEVRNFFDPNGPGKILDESELIEELNSTP